MACVLTYLKPHDGLQPCKHFHPGWLSLNPTSCGSVPLPDSTLLNAAAPKDSMTYSMMYGP